jgi:hypothetical protein
MKNITQNIDALIKPVKLVRLLLITIFLSLVQLSCKKLVTVDAPTNVLVTTSVFNTDGTAITAQLAVYADLARQLADFGALNGSASDELTNFSTTQFNIDVYLNNLNAQNDGGFNGYWSVLYKNIYQENAIIENVQASAGMSNSVKQLMTGEALFMRAWCYFQLVNMFGDVPLVTTTDYKVNSTLARTPKDQVYGQMVNDLTVALGSGLLSPAYLDPNDNAGITDRVRPTTWAAHALLARVYLYMGKYDLANQEAGAVISNSSMFSLVTDLNKVFKKNSSEAIWQLMPATGKFWSTAGNGFILVAPPAAGTNGAFYALSPQLLSAFEPNDARKINWIGRYTQGVTTWNFAYKYKDNNTATTLNEYDMVLRLAEQYLIRAEAEANGAGNGLNGAVSDLNAIRNRAGLPNYSGSVDKTSLLTAIAHERQVELFTENYRWFDLKRTKTVDAVMSVVTPLKGGAWNSYQQLYSLNVSDLQYNPNLVQNPGY